MKSCYYWLSWSHTQINTIRQRDVLARDLLLCLCFLQNSKVPKYSNRISGFHKSCNPVKFFSFCLQFIFMHSSSAFEWLTRFSFQWQLGYFSAGEISLETLLEAFFFLVMVLCHSQRSSNECTCHLWAKPVHPGPTSPLDLYSKPHAFQNDHSQKSHCQ